MTVLPWKIDGHNASHATSSSSNSLYSSSRSSSSTANTSSMEHDAPVQALKPLPALELADPSSRQPSSPVTPLPTPVRSNSLRVQKPSSDNRHHAVSSTSTHDEAAQRKPRKMLGNYTLTKTLGAGSMGKVKLAVHGVTGYKVHSVFDLQMFDVNTSYKPCSFLQA